MQDTTNSNPVHDFTMIIGVIEGTSQTFQALESTFQHTIAVLHLDTDL